MSSGNIFQTNKKVTWYDVNVTTQHGAETFLKQNNQWHGSMPTNCPLYCDVIWKHIPDKQKSDMI